MSGYFTNIPCKCDTPGYVGTFCETKLDFCKDFTCPTGCNKSATDPTDPCNPCPGGFNPILLKTELNCTGRHYNNTTCI